MKNRYFGEFGGCFVPELLMPPLLEVEAAMRDILPLPAFQAELVICCAIMRVVQRP